MEGVEPPSSFSCEIEGFRSNMSLDSFPDYRLAESCQERTDALLLTAEISVFGVAQTPTAYFREGLLLLTLLESPSSFSATGSGLLCGLGQLFELALVGLAGAGRLEGGLVFLVCPRHRVSPPLRRSIGDRKELTSPFKPCFCAKHDLGLVSFATPSREVNLSTKAFIIITLIIKKCNNIPEYFYISPASRSFSNCSIPL